MPKIYNMCLLLQRFLTEYYQLLITFQQNYAPREPGLRPDPRYLKSQRELPYIICFLACMNTDPVKFLQTAQRCGLLRMLARELDRWEKEGGDTAA